MLLHKQSRSADAANLPLFLPEKRDPLGSAWMIVAALVFALMGMLTKMAGQRFGLGFHELVFWRGFVGACLLAVPACRMKGRTWRTRHFQAHLWRGLAGTLGLMLSFYAIVHLPLGTAVTLNYTSSLFLALLSYLFLREKIAGSVWWVLLLGFAGIVLLLKPAFSAGQAQAALVGLASGLAAAWAYLQVRQLSQLGEPAWRVVLYFCVVSSCVSGVMALYLGWHTVPLAAWPYLLGIGITATLAQWCMTRAYQVGCKFTVAALSYLTVVFASLLGVWVLDDVLNGQEWLGILVIVAAGVSGSMVNRPR